MTLTEFDNGYWYADQLKKFAKDLRIPSASKLRKDELETAIRRFLSSGKIENPAKRNLTPSGRKNLERGLSLRLMVKIYTNDKVTKDFLEAESLKIAPGLKRKSGARYRLNRWREEQIRLGVEITYRDLVQEYVRLNAVKGPFEQVPHGRYINFVSDYDAAHKNVPREEVLEAWESLKKLDVPKTYAAWAKWQKEAR